MGKSFNNIVLGKAGKGSIQISFHPRCLDKAALRELVELPCVHKITSNFIRMLVIDLADPVRWKLYTFNTFL